MKNYETQIDRPDRFTLTVINKGNYSIEDLAEDFRSWAERQCVTYLEIPNAKLNLKEIFTGFKVLGPKIYVGNVEVIEKDTIEIALNRDNPDSLTLCLDKYEPFNDKLLRQ
jgi:hypothetical protein